MKFWYKVIYFFVSCILLVGCASVQDANSISTALDENNTVEVHDNVDNNVNEREEVKDDDQELSLPAENPEIKVYDCLFQRIEQGDLIQIEIHYPQFRTTSGNGMGEREEINRINNQIFDYLMQEEYFVWIESRYNASVTYEICYIGNDYLSVIFEGYHNEFNHEKTPSALNFDLRTGELIDLETIISQEELWKCISENPESVLEGEWISSVGGREGVIEYLKEYLQVYGHKYDFALTERGIKIIVFNEMDNRIYYIAEIINE